VVNKKNVKRYENGFEIHSVKMGDPQGKLAKAGKQVKVRYVGRLKSNGKEFDKSGNKPFTFRLGEWLLCHCWLCPGQPATSGSIQSSSGRYQQAWPALGACRLLGSGQQLGSEASVSWRCNNGSMDNQSTSPPHW
jgi:hypothetical protein